MTNIDDARKLAASLRAIGDQHANLMAYTIEAALDDAVGHPLKPGETVLAVNARDQMLLRASLQITLATIDGRDPDFKDATELLQRVVALDTSIPESLENPMADPA
jgi:hypothetical protein